MFFLCVQKFDVMNTVEIFLGSERGLIYECRYRVGVPIIFLVSASIPPCSYQKPDAGNPTPTNIEFIVTVRSSVRQQPT